MISKTQEDFWNAFNRLPAGIQQLAREKFRLWREDVFNAAFHFKPLFEDVWSVRVNQQYRAMGRRKGSLIVWFWIAEIFDTVNRKVHREIDDRNKRNL